ncbi:response regulator transcription factor [Chloroflexota bacterium]
MKNNIQILVIDDHQVIREGIRRLLSEEIGFELVGQGANSEEALLQVDMLSPDIVLMDIKMPGISGIEITRQIKDKYPSCNIIMLTFYDEYLSQALEAGASGYLLKDIKREELIEAIKRVHTGQVIISDSIQMKVQRMYSNEMLPKSTDNLGTLVDEIQLVISPPVDIRQLMRFTGHTEEKLQSRVMQMVGASKDGTIITFALNNATNLSSILSSFKGIPEIETITEVPSAIGVEKKLIKKTMSIPKINDNSRATLFVTLERN